jgi:hypothetical protein
MAKDDKPGTDVVVDQRSMFTDEELADLQTFDDVLRAAQERETILDSANDYGTGFRVLDNKDKAKLIDEPMIIVEWRFNSGNFGEFVSCLVMTKAGEKVVLNDGSTGIRDQLSVIVSQRLARGSHTQANAQAFLVVPDGLRVSRYEYTAADGSTAPAETFYLNI